ncbi:dihydrofolate reductase family protein [Portibacter marinus]|uniref:dihydrofolate reductase family protein n=1 Tax=Portibacter marinus TaxID=2898660 RepID=UPI001F1FF405|nr:dihydrofolate reductase family protein [Portibacter marinus]
MKKIIYYVATSLDGYIAGSNEDISLFVGEGNGVDYYLADLQNFKTVIMGRKTYEFGYKFGMKPGDLAYPHMKHYIFSDNLKFESASENIEVASLSVEKINEVKEESETDVYLCGGGQLAGWMLDHGLIDELKLKINPIILGEGVPVFGSSKRSIKMELKEQLSFDHGLIMNTYLIN